MITDSEIEKRLVELRKRNVVISNRLQQIEQEKVVLTTEGLGNTAIINEFDTMLTKEDKKKDKKE